jgi:outer membrane protein TolC
MLRLQKLLLTILIGSGIFLSFGVAAQSPDSTLLLNAEQVLEIVRKFHPVSRQTDLHIEQSRADLLIAKGAFDPVIGAYVSRKTFGGTNYYNQTSPQLTIPTWFGIEIHSGLENLTGNRLDPTKTAGKSSYIGVTIPLAKDLLMDKRRAFLKQARIFNTMAITEQRAVVNDLLMDAMDAYWLWVQAYQTFKVVQASVAVNEERLALVKKAFSNGERPAIDTVEALTQLQSFQYQQNERWLAFQNRGLELSAYLWTKDTEPYTLPVTVVPQDGWENETNINSFNTELGGLLDIAMKGHPEIQLYDSKLDVLDIEKRLKFQLLLPKADFTYNHLSKGYGIVSNEYLTPLFDNNYQYGFKFGLPLRLSEGRGEYRKAKIKIESTNLELDQKRLAVQVKVKSYFNEFTNLKSQIALQSNTYTNYQQLVRAEGILFQNGESSLFLVNTRENKALEAQQKLIELKTKYYKTIYALQWSAGLLVL